MILFTLRSVEKNTEAIDYESDNDNNIGRKMRAWTNALPVICEKFELGREETIAIFNRLYRTGCFVSTAGYWDHESGMGTISPIFERIINLVQ